MGYQVVFYNMETTGYERYDAESIDHACQIINNTISGKFKLLQQEYERIPITCMQEQHPRIPSCIIDKSVQFTWLDRVKQRLEDAT